MHRHPSLGALAVAALGGAGIVAIGARFLVRPDPAIEAFGVPVTSDPYPAIKGVRDIGTGAIVLALLGTRQYRALGLTLAMASVIPLGDAAIVLTHGGSAAAALGIHGATAAAMLAAAGPLIRTAA